MKSMCSLTNKIKRQSEILGHVLAFPNRYKIIDFEKMYNVNNLTIKRDLQELRSVGVDIHSVGDKGINVISKIPQEILESIVLQYIGISVYQNTYDQATRLLISKLGTYSIFILTQIQMSIENSRSIRIAYLKSSTKSIEERIIDPYCIFQGDKQLRLLANHENTMKQFILANIKSIEILDNKFKPIPQKQINEIFTTSFLCWLGNEHYKVRLKFLPPISDRLRTKRLMEFQKVVEAPDGSVEYETSVNSLNEIARWIVSQGEGVIVLSPQKLKRLVIETAKSVLKNYQ